MTGEEYEERMRKLDVEAKGHEERMKKLVARIDAETAWQRLLFASSVWLAATLVAVFGWDATFRWTGAAVAVVAVGFAGDAARELLRRPW